MVSHWQMRLRAFREHDETVLTKRGVFLEKLSRSYGMRKANRLLYERRKPRTLKQRIGEYLYLP